MILESIIQHKIEEVSRKKADLSLPELERKIRGIRPAGDFAGAIRSAAVAIIAEVKKGSPSAGRIREDLITWPSRELTRKTVPPPCR